MSESNNVAIGAPSLAASTYSLREESSLVAPIASVIDRPPLLVAVGIGRTQPIRRRHCHAARPSVGRKWNPLPDRKQLQRDVTSADRKSAGEVDEKVFSDA